MSQLLKKYIEVLKKDPQHVKVGIKSLDSIVNKKIELAHRMREESYGGVENKEYKFNVGLFLTISDILVNTLLISAVQFMSMRSSTLRQMPPKIEKLASKNALLSCAFNYVGNTGGWAQIFSTGLVPILTEETSKLAAYKLGVLKEYMAVFNSLEFVTYVMASIESYEYNKVFRNLEKHKQFGILVPYVQELFGFYHVSLGKKFTRFSKSSIKAVENYYNNYKQHRRKMYDFLKYLSSVSAIRLILVGLHYIFAFFHTIGMPKTAMTLHFLWNSALGLLFICFLRRKGVNV